MEHLGVKIESDNKTLVATRFHGIMAALDCIRQESRSIDKGRAYLYEDGTCIQEFMIQDGLSILWS